MKTITFYSYKGGVGRSLALANIATRLVEFGKKVCLLDFDLEAPGLNLKFPQFRGEPIESGLVDYIYQFTHSGILPERISDYTMKFSLLSKSEPIHLIPAGNTNSTDYWKKLSAINWYNLLYESDSGLEFFLDLKAKIESEINPDFLLIDSRTGISEMSGITLSLLADEVVIVSANNIENLSGVQKVIKAISDPEKSLFNHPPKVTFVLSRVPFTEKPEDRMKEKALLERIKRNYLLPYISEVNILHSDRELEIAEQIKISEVTGIQKDESLSQISNDYLKLFEKITSSALSEEDITKFKKVKDAERLYTLAISPNLQDKQEKLSNLDSAIGLNDIIEYRLARAAVYQELNNFEGAVSDLKNILHQNPVHETAIHMLIYSLNKLRNFDAAIEECNRALEIFGQDAFYFFQKAYCYTKKSDADRALELYTKSIELDPLFDLAYNGRADVYKNRGQFELALKDIHKGIEVNPERDILYLTLAEIHGLVNNHNEFYIYFDMGLRLLTEDVDLEVLFREEPVYKKYMKDERFLNTLEKYKKVIPSDVLETV